MNLVSRCSERTPDVLALLHQKARGKPDKKVINLWAHGMSSIKEQGDLFLDANSSNYSEWKADKNWSSQEWQGRLACEQPPGMFTEHTDKFIVDDNDMDSDTDAASDMSLLSRSFLHRVNDRVRKIQDQSSKDVTQDSNKHSLMWWMFMSSTLEASVFMGNNYSENVHSIKNTGKDFTMKPMFDISEKLITEQSDEIYGVYNLLVWFLHGNIYL